MKYPPFAYVMSFAATFSWLFALFAIWHNQPTGDIVFYLILWFITAVFCAGQSPEGEG